MKGAVFLSNDFSASNEISDHVVFFVEFVFIVSYYVGERFIY